MEMVREKRECIDRGHHSRGKRGKCPLKLSKREQFEGF